MNSPEGASQSKPNAAFPSFRLPVFSRLTRPPSALLLLAALTALAYADSFSVPFLFDDRRNLLENPWIKDPRHLLDFSGSRYVGFLTFALNYHFGGLSVFGYHLVNLLIHLVNALLVFALVRLLFRALSPDDPDPKAGGVALAAALLFAVHPIQTQAVTYIVQRFASLAALFDLLAVVAYLKWRLTPSPTPHSRLPTSYLWYALALISTVLAMKTKENAFTLPIILILMEAVFFRPFSRKRWTTLIPFLSTMLIIPFSRLDVLTGGQGGILRQTTRISRWDYLVTQFPVIMTYLRLLIWPVHQNLDYDYPVYHSLLTPRVFFSFFFLCALFGLSVYLLFFSRPAPRIHRLAGFGILWFFITLSVESSVIPLEDVIFEHRLYLPSVGFFLAAAILAGGGAGRMRVAPAAMALVLAAVVGSLAWATFERNKVWGDELTLWSDVAAQSPGKARPHNNLGVIYDERGKTGEAIREFQTAIRLNAGYTEAYGNLASALRKAGRSEEAESEARRALSVNPKFPGAYNTLGLIDLDRGRFREAAANFQKAIDLKPEDIQAYNNLGLALGKQNLFEEAERAYRSALDRNPDAVEPHLNLALLYAKTGRMEEAIAEWIRALALRPDDAEARFNLATAYRMAGRPEEAGREYRRALELKPGWKLALDGLNKLGEKAN